MKKLLLIIFIAQSTQAFVFYCSSSIEDGGPPRIMDLEVKAQAQLASVSASWTLIQALSSQIKKQSEEKKRHLENIASLTKYNTLKEQKIKFEYIRYKKLLGIYNDTTGSVK